jgi:uncharacterized damage-inducible protein DinB
MNKASFDRSWNYFRTVNGVGLRAIAALPADQLDSHPIPNMRSPKELVIHQYQIIRDLTQAIVDGEAIDSTPFEEAAAKRIKTKDELLAFCRESWAAGAKSVAKVTDAQVQGTVNTPWGHSFTGYVMLQTLTDEYWHHRGQLYTYLRALGAEPPSLYDFENNEADFKEQQEAGA